MADKETPKTDENPTEVFIKVNFNTKNGQLGVSSNVPSQITQLGMLAMATALVAKPKESTLLKAAAGMFSKKA